MIASISGRVEEKELEKVIIETNGIGYLVSITTKDYDELEVGKNTKLYIFENIREDSYDLYGFVYKSTKSLFNQLISVKNVGPKVALSILSLGSDQEIKNAIAGGDVKFLVTAKGVGKRAAEQVVVELRDKVGLVATDEAENVLTRRGININDEALLGLMSLGYSQSDASTVLSKVDINLPVDERIKEALKG
ncbi:MAG: Holliday junction branch migration protein RuvA [bacterium]|jgi:Holliday junction DNA helicase RuvA